MSKHLLHLATLALLVFLGVLIPVRSSALTEEECVYPDTLYQRWEGYRLPPDLIGELPAAFDSASANHLFTIQIDWNPALADSLWPWHPDSIKGFAERVMPDSPADPMEASLAHRIASYFGEDTDPSYAGIALVVGGKSFTQFAIQIVDSVGGGSTGDIGGVRLYLPNDPGETTHVEMPSIARLANDAFAHEWQHSVWYSLHPNVANCFSAGSTTEFFSQAAEHVADSYWLAPTDTTDSTDVPYSRAPMLNDYYNECCGHPNNQRHHTWALLAPYFLHHFDLGEEGGWRFSDLLYKWLRVEEPNQVYRRQDLWALSDSLLQSDRYNEYFEAAEGEGNARVRELFQNYTLALWANSLHFDELPDSAAVWWEPGKEPQELYGYLQNWDRLHPAGDCFNDARTRLYYNFVTTSDTTVFGPIYPRDLHDIDDYSNSLCASSTLNPRELQFSGYGYEILPFVADSSIVNQGDCYTLRVDLFFEDEYACGPFPDKPSELTDNDHLQVRAIGYPTARDDLDLFGSEAEILFSWASDSLATKYDSLCFAVPCFGSRYQSVALLLTLTEQTIEEGFTVSHTVPYHYRFYAEHGSSTVSTDTTWPPDAVISGSDFCIPGEITVEEGATLTIEPGLTLWCATADSLPLEDYVGFSVAGTLDIGVAGMDSVRFVPLSDSWDGFAIASGGSLTIDTASLIGMDEVASEDGAALVDIERSHLVLADGAAGLELRDTDTARLSNCLIENGRQIFLSDAEVDSTNIHQVTATTTAITIEGDVSLEQVKIYNAYTAVRCLAGDSISIRNLSAQANASGCGKTGTLGLVVAEDARVNVENSTFDGFCVGIRVEDSPTLTVRRTSIEDAGLLGVYIQNTSPSVDLGNSGASDPGQNCIATTAPSAYRVYNLSASLRCKAEGNYWGVATPSGSLFYGDVDWNPYEESCPAGAGGPQFFLAGSAETPETPLGLSAPYPNPFNPTCMLHFALPADGASVDLSIFDLSGRMVRTIFSGRADGAEHTATWDGRNHRGDTESSGVYFARLAVGEAKVTKKLILIR